MNETKNKWAKMTCNVQDKVSTTPISCIMAKQKWKSWCKLKCDRTKRQRLEEYGNVLFSTIKNIPHFRKAHLSLSLDNKTVNYQWRSKDWNNDRDKKQKVFNFEGTSDHSYASPKLILLQLEDEDDDYGDIDYSQIFDSEGNWHSKHKRTIINVMDSFRISHEAYHKLRSAGKGQFPPLHHIIKEKISMSAEIPYIKHPTVS